MSRRPVVVLLGSPTHVDRVGFVTPVGQVDPVRVRWRPPGTAAWRCDEFGPHPEPQCLHELAVVRRLRSEKENP